MEVSDRNKLRSFSDQDNFNALCFLCYLHSIAFILMQTRVWRIVRKNKKNKKLLVLVGAIQTFPYLAVNTGLIHFICVLFEHVWFRSSLRMFHCLLIYVDDGPWLVDVCIYFVFVIGSTCGSFSPRQKSFYWAALWLVFSLQIFVKNIC